MRTAVNTTSNTGNSSGFTYNAALCQAIALGIIRNMAPATLAVSAATVSVTVYVRALMRTCNLSLLLGRRSRADEIQRVVSLSRAGDSHSVVDTNAWYHFLAIVDESIAYHHLATSLFSVRLCFEGNEYSFPLFRIREFELVKYENGALLEAR